MPKKPKLSPEERKAAYAPLIVQGLKPFEIAKELGIPSGTVRADMKKMRDATLQRPPHTIEIQRRSKNTTSLQHTVAQKDLEKRPLVERLERFGDLIESMLARAAKKAAGADGKQYNTEYMVEAREWIRIFCQVVMTQGSARKAAVQYIQINQSTAPEATQDQLTALAHAIRKACVQVEREQGDICARCKAGDKPDTCASSLWDAIMAHASKEQSVQDAQNVTYRVIEPEANDEPSDEKEKNVNEGA